MGLDPSTPLNMNTAAPAPAPAAAEMPALVETAAAIKASQSFAWSPKSESAQAEDDQAVSSILASLKEMLPKKQQPLGFLQLAMDNGKRATVPDRVLVAADFLAKVGASTAMERLASRIRSGGPHGELKPQEAGMLLQALAGQLERNPKLAQSAAQLKSDAAAADKQCATAVAEEEKAAASAAQSYADATDAHDAAVAELKAIAPAWEKRAAARESLADGAASAVQQWKAAAAQQRTALSGEGEAVAAAGAARAARIELVAEEVSGAALRLRAAVGSLRKELAPPAAPAQTAPPTLDHLQKVQSDCEANLARVAAQELEQSRGRRVIQAAADMLR